jgi:apolipoprotein N-acyltransferase
MIKTLALSILSGIAFVFAFPPFSMGLLAWIALVPLFFALETRGWKGGFSAGFLAGFFFNLGAVYWVVHSMANYGGVPVAMSVLVMLILVLYMALYWGVFGLLYTLTRGLSGIARLFLIPAFWVGLEYGRAHLLTGFPWVLTGYTQAPNPALIQIADITGVWGVSFVLVAFNAAVAFLAAGLLRKNRDERVPVLPIVVASAIVVSMAAYGIVRMKTVDAQMLKWPSMKVALAQGSIDQGVKWDGRYQQETINIYRKLTEEASSASARLVVWPETAIPYYYDAEEVRDGQIGALARSASTYILTGSPSYNYNPESKKVSYFNSAFLVDPRGQTIGRYDKYHLVPFGEYLPLRGILPFEKLTAGIGDFTEGQGPVPIAFEGASIGTLICFESIFPEIARGHIKNGATLLATITNDAWFGRTSAPYQHFQMSIFRAVENRSFLVRAANTGVSGVIDANGRVRKTTGLYERTAIVDDVGLRQGPLTFYTVYGDFFAWGCSIVSVAFVVLRKRRGAASQFN